MKLPLEERVRLEKEERLVMENEEKKEVIQETTDYTKLPAGHEVLKPMLDFLPDEETKEGLLAGFTMFMSIM